MTTKSPTSTCGAYWGLCLPRRSCAVWLASRPSTTSVASMTCQARAISPGLGVYVRTALVSSSSSGWLVGSPHRVRETVQHARHQPAHAPAGHDTSRGAAPLPPEGEGPTGGSPADSGQPFDVSSVPAATAPTRGTTSAHLAQVSGLHVVDGAAHVAREQVRALPDELDGLPDVGLDVGERTGRPRRPPPGGLLDH